LAMPPMPGKKSQPPTTLTIVKSVAKGKNNFDEYEGSHSGPPSFLPNAEVEAGEVDGGSDGVAAETPMILQVHEMAHSSHSNACVAMARRGIGLPGRGLASSIGEIPSPVQIQSMNFCSTPALGTHLNDSNRPYLSNSREWFDRWCGWPGDGVALGQRGGGQCRELSPYCRDGVGRGLPQCRTIPLFQSVWEGQRRMAK
jgi:hypothetical protein